MDFFWYLACHKKGVRNFFLAQMLLENMEVKSFTPLVIDKKKRCGELRSAIKSLFPGYFFVYFNPLKQRIRDIESVPGFSHFVKFGVELKPLRSEVINQVMEMQSALTDDYLKKERIPDEIPNELVNIFHMNDEHEKFLHFCKYAKIY
ncbi:transcriptional antiterminator RfaH [Izhakiella capsodis]|uniref:Transcriptional antiterminator RfaH n=1 Tax=Izhakiella capsodis TaxID=1367852 RepID=A0A1I4W4U2_9GAMM|nr:transcription termination/antitermination NusG family protein [Izhakiella capsodis]SFN08571.1 transcriptional antiterminator RfaH [Izhakiella capsodis]